MLSLSYLLNHLRSKTLLNEEGELAGIAVQDKGDSVIDFLLQWLPWKEEELKRYLSSLYKIELFLDREFLIDRKLPHWIEAGLSAKLRCLPLKLEGNRLKAAVDDPFSLLFWHTIENDFNLEIDLVLILRSDFQSLYRQLYNRPAPPFQLVSKSPELALSLPWAFLKEQDDLLQVLEQACQKRATDIHFEPLKHSLRVRFRVDGVLYMHRMFEEDKKETFLTRLKIWAELNIAQQRLPQDGQFQKVLAEESIDFRLSTLPLIYGEKAVLRLLRKSFSLRSPAELGMEPEILSQFERLLRLPQGMILVCGPTASGKTTTLYSALQQLDRDSLNIVTIEDPVEFHLPGIQQMQVSTKIDATFSKGLRAILRQDPDVILIGEIRDRETAEVAFQAALTGHLVFASLHTNDAPGAITRLLDMGLEPFLLTSTISGIIAQRLVRKVCTHCAIYEPLDAHLFNNHLTKNKFSLPSEIAQAGPGCAHCQQQPLQDRLGIFELLLPNDTLNQLIMSKAPIRELREQAYQNGMKPFYLDGLEKAAKGQTAFSEILPYIPYQIGESQ